MKNAQQNDQKRNEQSSNPDSHLVNTAGKAQQQSPQTGQPGQSQNQTNQPSQKQSPGNEKSNITVDNEGKIGKAAEQWDNNTNGASNPSSKEQQKDRQIRSDKTVTEPEIDSPVYEPEKTEKKIPRMGNDNGNK